MAYNYLVPRLSPLYPGYSCSGHINSAALAARLIDGAGMLDHTIRIYREGSLVDERITVLEFRNARLVNNAPDRFEWNGAEHDWGDLPGVLEEDVRVADRSLRFSTRYNRSAYTLNWASGRKSYLINLSPKFADQRIIEQIAQFRRFVDTCSTVWIDRELDYGQSFILVNPFRRPVTVRIRTEDGRELRGNRVPPQSARIVRMVKVLKPGESRWRGQVQITASNRLLVSDCKHLLSDPGHVVDMEHLDPFRTDPTHLAGFRWLRQKVGRAMADRGLLRTDQ